MAGLKLPDDDLLLLMAFRYALGRRTYVVSYIVGIILNNWESLEPHRRQLIKNEINEHKRLWGNLGHDCDEQEWNKILSKSIINNETE